MKRAMIAIVTVGLGVFTVEAALYDFVDGGEFDNPAVIGSSMTVDGITITTEDIQGWDGSAFTLNSAGGAHRLNINGTVNALAVNSASTPAYIVGGTEESRDFEPGEAWLISFDTDVFLSEIDLQSVDNDAQLTISASEFASIVINDDGGSADVYSLGNTFVSAGTVIKFENTAPGVAGNEFRIDSLTVIPEPATIGLVATMGGGLLFLRRRFML